MESVDRDLGQCIKRFHMLIYGVRDLMEHHIMCPQEALRSIIFQANKTVVAGYFLSDL